MVVGLWQRKTEENVKEMSNSKREKKMKQETVSKIGSCNPIIYIDVYIFATETSRETIHITDCILYDEEKKK